MTTVVLIWYHFIFLEPVWFLKPRAYVSFRTDRMMTKNTFWKHVLKGCLSKSASLNHKMGSYIPVVRTLSLNHKMGSYIPVVRTLSLHHKMGSYIPVVRTLSLHHKMGSYIPVVRTLSLHHEWKRSLSYIICICS